jgi:membrane-associated phospholipid phosphatase
MSWRKPTSNHGTMCCRFHRNDVLAALTYPRLRLPLDVLAAAIGFSRVYTGVHYPTDVVAGWLLGRGIGTLVRGLAAAGRIRRTPAPWPAERTVRS